MYKRLPTETLALAPHAKNYTALKTKLEYLNITLDDFKDDSKVIINEFKTNNCTVDVIALTEAIDNQQVYDVGTFYHPIFIENKNDKISSFIDLRTVTSKDGFKFKLRNVEEYNLFNKYASLSAIWAHDSHEVKYLKEFSALPAFVFAECMFEALNRTYQLNPEEQFKVKVLTAYYYSEILHKTTHNESNLHSTAMLISRSTKIAANIVLTILETNQVEINDIASFCLAIASIDEIKLGRFNVAVLFTLFGNIWLGIASKERIAVALEYPPLWIAICYSALSDSSYKRTALGRTVERVAKITDTKNFIMSIEQITAEKEH